MKLPIAAVLLAVLAKVSAGQAMTDSDAMEAFAHQYVSQLQGDPRAEKVFSVVNLPAAEVAKATQRTLFEHLNQKDHPDADSLSRMGGETVAQYLDSKSPAEVMKIMGYNLALTLSQHGDLQPDTASQLATEAARDFLSVVGDTSTPSRQVQAIFDGYDRFWARFGYEVQAMWKVIMPQVVSLFGTKTL